MRSALESEHYHLHKFLGVNKDLTTEKISIRFWAANAKAVSLIADFNDWSISASPMTKIDESGIWSITLPSRKKSFSYQFAIHQLNGEIKIANDPFSQAIELNDRVSSHYNESCFEWQDQVWIKQRETSDIRDKTLVIKSIDLNILNKGDFENYQSLANHIIDLAHDENFSHVELVNFSEAIIDLTYSNQFTLSKEALFFAPSSAYGQINDFKCLIDFLHQKGIGVILNLSYFSNEIISNYGGFKTLQKTIHENFYLSNIIFWLEEMHIDAFNFGPLEQVLLKENKKNREFLNKANQVIHKRAKGVFSIAQETNCFSLLTNTNKESLDFDFKLNIIWQKQLIELLRSPKPNLVDFSSNLLSENFLLGIMKNIDLRGLTENDLKVYISLCFLLPSKKYFRQDILERVFSKFSKLREFFQDISILYEEESLLFETDLLAQRFCVNQLQKDIAVFQRSSYDFSKQFITVANFSNSAKQSFQVDVNKAGFYREIFNSANYSKQSSLTNEDGIYTYSNQQSLSNKSIVIDVPAKTVLCYSWE